MIIGIDFDGTVVKHRYPNIGDELRGSVSTLKRLVEKGHKLVLLTMRDGEVHKGPFEDPSIVPVNRGVLYDAIEWFKERGIELWNVNTNPDQKRWTLSPKVYCNLYIDDAGLGCPVNVDESGRRMVDWWNVDLLLYRMEVLDKKDLEDIFGAVFEEDEEEVDIPEGVYLN